jgi:hypothetical protein
VSLDNVANPHTFNDENDVTFLFNVANPLTFNDDNNVVSPFNVVKTDTSKPLELKNESC